jgi:ABC-2 type transport system permease protein
MNLRANLAALESALFLARTETWYLLRRRETLLWTFVMPVVFFFFIGSVTSNSSTTTREELAVMVPVGAGFLADQVTARLEQLGYTIVRPNSPQQFQAFRRRLEIPAGFTESVLAGRQMNLQFSRTGDDINADYDRVRLNRAVYTVLADLVAVTNKDGAATPESFAQIAAQPRQLALDVKSAGQRVDPPTGFDQSVPGTMVMFTLLIMFTAGAVTLTIERNQGILRRLASSSMTRGAVTLGKWGSRMSLGLIQLAFALLAGRVLFHVHWGPHLPMVMLVLVCYAAFAAILGMLLGNFGRTEGQVIAIGVIASNLLAGLGGCWWPIEVVPLWAQKLSLALPTGLAMDALHKLVNFGASPAAVLPHLAALLALTLAGGYILARTFRFQT